jgi:hypothetical protein
MTMSKVEACVHVYVFFKAGIPSIPRSRYANEALLFVRSSWRIKRELVVGVGR